MWYGVDQASAIQCAAVEPGHVGLGPALIKENKTPWIDAGNPSQPFPPPYDDVGPVLLGGAK